MIHMLYDRLVFLWRYDKNLKFTVLFVSSHAVAHIWRSEDNLESWFSFHHVDPWTKLRSLGMVASTFIS